MLEASRIRSPGVEVGAQSDRASEAGGATGSRQGRRQERAEVEARAEVLAEVEAGRSYGRRREAWTELRTPARGTDGAVDAGEGDPERQVAGGGDAGGGAGGCKREPERELEMCRAGAGNVRRLQLLHKVTHSLLFFLP